MKTLTLSTIVVGMYQSPIVALLIAIALVFIADLLNQYIESKKIICTPADLATWSYRDIQLLAIANGIRGNQKKVRLINCYRRYKTNENVKSRRHSFYL